MRRDIVAPCPGTEHDLLLARDHCQHCMRRASTRPGQVAMRPELRLIGEPGRRTVQCPNHLPVTPHTRRLVQV